MIENSGQPRSIADSIRRVVNIARIIGVVLLLSIVVTGVRQLIAFYSNEVGLSAPSAAETYTRALLSGNLDLVYDMSDRASLTDLYGKPVQRTEFMAEARRAIGADRLSVQSIVVIKLFDKDGTHYYQVDVTFSSGVPPAQKSLFLRLRNEEGIWLVAWPLGLTS